MNRNDFLAILFIGILIVAGLWAVIPSIGLAIAIARGMATVPLGLRETVIVIFIACGGVGAIGGAVVATSKIAEKRRSAFLALCACGEWFIADSIGDLYLEHHSPIEKTLFQGLASLAFALAGGLWSTEKRMLRAVSILLFLAPSLALLLKLLGPEPQMTFHGWRLAVLVAAPLIMAAIYIGLTEFGYLKE